MPQQAEKFPQNPPEPLPFSGDPLPNSGPRSSLMKWAGITFSAALLLGACGSSDDDPAPTDGPETTDSPTEPAPDPTTEPDPDPTTDEPPTDEPTSPEPDGERSVVWEPVCDEEWDPPELPLMEASDLVMSTEMFETDEWLIIDGEITNVGPHWEGAIYTWPVVVQDGIIASPMLLGSDAIFDVSLDTGDTATAQSTHSMVDFCQDGNSSNRLEAGDYEAYLLVLDIAAYNEDESRAVVAVSDSAPFSINADGEIVLP